MCINLVTNESHAQYYKTTAVMSDNQI